MSVDRWGFSGLTLREFLEHARDLHLDRAISPENYPPLSPEEQIRFDWDVAFVFQEHIDGLGDEP
jgi:hypothetical protein